MRLLFGTLLVLFVAASTALIAIRDPGYVLITRAPYAIETSLAVFLPILALAFVVFYYLLRLISRIWHSPRDLMRWRQTRRTRRARESFLSGLTELAGGEWYPAEKSLLASMHATDSPLLANLAAAVAAHRQNDHAKRDRYLGQALDHAGAKASAVQLLRARLLIADGDYRAAQEVLSDLHAETAVHGESTRLLVTVLHRTRDWAALARLLPEMRRHHWLPDDELLRLEIETHGALLDLDLSGGDRATLQTGWEAVPKHLRRHPTLVAAYVRQLLRQDDRAEAVRQLEATLEKTWDERLVRLYGETAGPNPDAQLETAEDWLARHGESPALYLALGQLAHRARQNDRARNYLDKSLALGPSSEVHEELGRLRAEQGDVAGALELYREALARCRARTATGTSIR